MALLERVGTLLRANLNDLIDRAEDPDKMVKQIILDMENQLMQVKTQVAISIADLHLLQKKRDECIQERDDYVRKAELAVSKQNDALARAAIERSLDAKRRLESFEQQLSDQKVQVENLKSALHKLDGKLADARAKSDVLIAKHHRARAAEKAAEAHRNLDANSASTAWDRMKQKVNHAEAVGRAHAELLGDNVDDQFAALEKQDEIDRLLAELKRGESVISMRRLAILFAILAAISSIEHIVLSGTAARIIQAPCRVCRALVKLSDWRAFLIGPIRLFQRTTSRGSGPWLGQGN